MRCATHAVISICVGYTSDVRVDTAARALVDVAVGRAGVDILLRAGTSTFVGAAIRGGHPRREAIICDADARGEPELGEHLEHAIAERRTARLDRNLGVHREVRTTCA